MKDGTAHQPVCALIGQPGERVEAAVAAQDPGPSAVVRESGSLASGLARADDTGAEWIWILDGSSAPRPNALAALLDALRRLDGLPQPVVMAGVVVDSKGRVDPGRTAWYRRHPTEISMSAVERRLLPIRAAQGPILVHRSSAMTARPPRTRIDPAGLFEWTGSLLRSGAGYLVPESESTAVRGVRDPLLDPRTVVRLIAGRSFTGFDRIRIAVDAAERLDQVSRRENAVRRE